MPWVIEQFLTTTGRPASGYQLFTYEAGTTTKLATYTDQSGSVNGSNPIILDSAGRPPSPILLLPQAYKFVLAPPNDSDPPLSPDWTADNIAAVPAATGDVDVTGVAGLALAVNEWVYLADGSGGTTAGRWYKTDSDAALSSTLPAVMGVVVAAAAGAGSAVTVRRLGRLTGTSGLTPGSTYYVASTAGAITATPPSNARRVGVADSTTSIQVAAEIVDPNKGYIPIDLLSARVVSAASIIQSTANIGGLLCSDTSPSIQRVNAATDQAVRVRWAAGVVTTLQLPTITYPPDLDDSNPVTVHILAAMSATNDTPTMGVTYFEGVGDTNAGGNTAAITGTTVAEYSVTIAAADVGAHPNIASISLTPAAHATDELRLYGAWVEYTMKLRST